MTDDSAFKKQVRARMDETGENYTPPAGWSSPGVTLASRQWRCGYT